MKYGVRGGWIGVDVFFVLSGFLITTLLLEEWNAAGTLRLGRFYLRRAFRLMPALLAMLAACWVYAQLCMSAEDAAATRGAVFSSLAYYANLRVIQDIRPVFLAHTWSLAVEEQFYFLWPALLAGMLKLKLPTRWLAFAVFLGIAASALWRIALWRIHGSFPQAYLRLDTRADSLLTGCLTSVLLSGGLLPSSRIWQRAIDAGAVLSIAFLGFICFTTRSGAALLHYGGFTLAAAATGIIILALIQGRPRLLMRVVEFRPLTMLGKISYGFYLWHYPIFRIIVPRYLLPASASPAVEIALDLGISLAVASCSYLLLELPFLRLKRRWETRAAPIFDSAAPLKRAA
jgi:peptidoglycan/LPS O-acetylase OafA/YrhL